ncbi:MAG: TIM barrel protein [Bacteroidetes bacterium]|nr:TIM barrel protein [Bacteroidota bacterium]
MERRNFIKTTMATAATASLGIVAFGNESATVSLNQAKFNLKYAPSFNAFPELAGDDPIDFIKFCNDQGFRAIFDNNLMKKDPALQGKIAVELNSNNMDIGPFVLRAKEGGNSMVYDDKESREAWKAGLIDAIETSKRTGAKYALIVPGKLDEKLEMDYQTANVIDTLRELSEMAEKNDLVIVIEPLNRWNHPGLFLTGIPQAYSICRAINSPSCKMVNDMYHQQITEGNIIPNIDRAWSEIGAFHIGDNPGRKEPGTGEINYLNIFKHIYNKGYDGVLCMEHGRSIKGIEGEKVLIEAYRKVDNFLS